MTRKRTKRRLSAGFSGNTQSIGCVIRDIDTGELIWSKSVNLGEKLGDSYGVNESFFADGRGGWFWIPPMYGDGFIMLLDLMLKDLGREVIGEIVAISGGFHQHSRMDTLSNASNVLANLNGDEPIGKQIAPMFTAPGFPSWKHGSATDLCLAANKDESDGLVFAKESGSWLTPRFPAASLRLAQLETPELLKLAFDMHSGSELFPMLLTGKPDVGLCAGEASAWNLEQLSSGHWSSKLVEMTAPGLLQKLPNIVSPLTKVGTVDKWLQVKYGFDAACMVFAFTGDNIASLLGVGSTVPGNIVLSLGTSFTLLDIVMMATYDPEAYGHVMKALTQGFMKMICQGSGGLSAKHFRKELKLGEEWTEFDDILAAALLQPDDFVFPFIEAECLGNRPAGIQFHGSFERNPKNVVPAVMNGLFGHLVAFATKFIGDLEGKEIIGTGGMSSAGPVVQWAADITGATITPSKVADTVANGGCVGGANAFLAEVDEAEEMAVTAGRLCEFGKAVKPRTDRRQNARKLVENVTAAL